MGAEAIVDLQESHPGVVNEEAFTALVHESMAKLVGRENIRIAREPNMGTEDFGAFMKRDLSVPGCFCSFGFGDGGGGPTIEYLEYLRRQTKGIPGIPNVKIEFAGDFLKRLEGKIEDNKKLLPKWNGELYLEFHRGTYTSVEKNK
jgi:metal-dependent amidase/aminoacylase/carboxypeptidase family protein